MTRAEGDVVGILSGRARGGETMNSLIGEAWRLYDEAADVPFVVRPSIPILFFGDSEAYDRSPVKIITVGLNPSLAEFPVADPFSRFRQAERVYPDVLAGRFYPEYLGALNAYFRSNPYGRWFGAFEPLLNGMDASFYDGRPHTVVHTDLCSPLATNPTWSGLGAGRERLRADGLALWLRLVRHLAPDVILVSVARHHLATLDFPVLGPWRTVHTVERDTPYLIEAMEIDVTAGKRALVIFGKAAQTPFATIKNVDKVEVGRRVAELVQGR